ncbi:hypothetical protein HAP94_16700 [Acidithiobacillus ferrivorans]|nr:hypothetical protein [Acidithiobacillus ferrivorans]
MNLRTVLSPPAGLLRPAGHHFEPLADLNMLAAYSLIANVVLFTGLLVMGHPLLGTLCSLLLDVAFVVLLFEAS